MLKINLTVILLLASPAALACSCVYPQGTQSENVRCEFNESDAVFSAYVKDVDTSEVSGQFKRTAKLRILQVWKGDLKPDSWLEITTEDDRSVSGCNYSTEQDQALMIYLRGKQQPYRIDSCSLTGSLNQATDDIPLLNELSDRNDNP